MSTVDTRPDDDAALSAVTMQGGVSAVARVRAAYRAIAAAGRPEVWITLRPEVELVEEAAVIDARAGTLPLAGTLVAVKGNIDVAGLPTTAACPSAAYVPTEDAPAVARLVAAGALVLGTTNLDQFATGLVGTRSPYGAVRHATLPHRISGGSSSGSAVAVALGLVDVALGTDTAGSGRVPAALHGIVGLKPTRGLVPTRGVVPAARSYDCVSVFARTLATAQRALRVITGPDPADPSSRAWPHDAPLAPRAAATVGVPTDADLAPLSPDARRAFATAVATLHARGVETVEVDLEPFLAAAELLYGGALVAERYDAVGSIVDAGLASGSDDLDPTVAAIIGAARELPAHRLARDQTRLASLRLAARAVTARLDALLLPTTVGHPTLAEVDVDPVGTNARLGTYTNFVNLLDLCAVAVPAGEADGGPFGVTLVADAFADQVAADLAALLTGEQDPVPYPENGIDLVVFGAHQRGEPLEGELRRVGARFREEVATSTDYRMLAMPTDPPRPAVILAAGRGGALAGERWTVGPAGLAALVEALPLGLAIGPVVLDDGRVLLGFLGSHGTETVGADITAAGGWRGRR